MGSTNQLQVVYVHKLQKNNNKKDYKNKIISDSVVS